MIATNTATNRATDLVDDPPPVESSRAAGSGRAAALVRDVILGGQDGLVNVLGLVLGMAVATGDSRVVVTAGLAAMLAESIAMAGVAYTSRGAERGTAARTGRRIRAAFVVGSSTLLGSAVPLVPFIVLPIGVAPIVALGGAVIVLFGAGVERARVSGGSRLRAGLELVGIGVVSALAGYVIGQVLRAPGA
jgi:VIT1/CCC1 family predicted Fe2+/Mn2+ transporter